MMKPVLPDRLSMTLNDRIEQTEGWVYMTGMQTLVRLPIEQARRDRAAGLKTGGYISGYRGSPIGTFDMFLGQAKSALTEHNIIFQPGLNEDLAATAVWGSQQVGLYPGATVDGVFSIWYGKAPGMDRSMDPLRHFNLAGTAPTGGTLMLVGDDHAAKSSTVACFSDVNFASIGVPLLAPANVQEVLDYGLLGIALSRYAGTLCGMKLVTDVVEGGGSVYVSPESPKVILPEAAGPHPGIQLFTPFLEQERRLWNEKLGRVQAFVRANGLNQIAGAKNARIGIVSAGKSWQDLSQALLEMGASGETLGTVPMRLLKLGATWPVDPEIVRVFADGLDQIVVVEEKRGFLEDQIKAILFDSRLRPDITGKRFANGDAAFPNHGECDPGLIARVLTQVVRGMDPDCGLPLSNTPGLSTTGGVIRAPSFCAGCPHGRSTQVVEGSRAMAGIGCHTMAMLRDPSRTNAMSHMGGEGAAWMGHAPFTTEPHVFANMGDGTFVHSGLLSIRAAVAAGSTMTFKLLFNGFVSMTGGQPLDGETTPMQIVEQIKAAGVGRVAIVADQPDQYGGQPLPRDVTVHARTELAHVERELRELKGVTAILYDQPCATERRRLRRRGKWADPDLRAYIHPEVCEGCGDCSAVSQCMAIEPLETPLGRKRVINQSACNKDFSCIEGFCPAFVTLEGATLRAQSVEIDFGDLPPPDFDPVADGYGILVAGIGGAGVVTTGQILAIAAHAAGYIASNLDITGMSQKYGAVTSHVKFMTRPEDRRATRIARGEALTLIGCDLLVAAGEEALAGLNVVRARAVLDTTVVPTGEFSQNPDWVIDGAAQEARLNNLLGSRSHPIPAQDLAERVMGDRLYANMILLGAAWQQGALPLPEAALMRAIELNGVKVEDNRKAFQLGRLYCVAPERLQQYLNHDQAESLDISALIADRRARLEAYGVPALTRRFSETVEKARAAGLNDPAINALVRGLYKLMAVKDEWEVARLYSSPAFSEQIEAGFDGSPKLRFHIGAWPFARKNRTTGKLTKGSVGPWILWVFRVLVRFRRLRGTRLDPFRNTEDARLGRDLLARYEADVALVCDSWEQADIGELTTLLDWPEKVRGYGHVRARNASQAEMKRQATLRVLGQSDTTRAAG